MAGLIGQAISNIGSTIGNYMLQSSLQEDRQEERRREREEEARRQAERAAADRAWREEQNATYRRTADQQAAAAAARSSGTREYTPEEQAVMAVASGRFGSQGDVDKFKSAVKTGDYSGYKQDITKTTVSDEGDPYRSDVSISTAKDYPPGFEREVQAKANVLASITRESVQGKNLDEVNKGRRTQQEIEGTDLALREPGKAGLVGQSMAAGAGKPLVDVKDGTAFNQYTAANAPTKVGESEIAENLAQARKALADAAKPGGATGAQQEKLATMLTSLSKILENPEISEKDRKAVGALQMQIAGAISATVEARTPGAGKDEKPTEADAHAQARAALATGKISLADVNKRLERAGYKPLPADAAAAKPTKADAPAKAEPKPKPTEAPEPADSPSAKFKQRQETTRQEQAAWQKAQVEQAAAAFQSLDLQDPLAASRLQDSPLFSYLTREQKAQVRKAVMGR